MKPNESVAKLTEYFLMRGVPIGDCTPREGFEQFFSFHESVKAEGCEDPGNDMLLFQWGVYDWGKGKFFELNITRQFIENSLEDDDAISQLSLTFKYEPNAAFEAISAGSAWSDGPSTFPTFPEHVFASSAFRAALVAKAKHIELAHWYV